MSADAEHFLAALPPSESYPCGYLPDRAAQQQHFWWPKDQGRMPSEVYQELMDRHFRRSGRLFYRPACLGCANCIPIRFSVAEFAWSASQARAWKKNSDLRVEFTVPVLDDRRFALYCRYATARHGGDRPSRTELEQFLYDSPTETLEASYWRAGELLGVGILDLTPKAVSSVYFFFEPDEKRRSLGVFSLLREIEFAREQGRPYYYLGYWVPGCRKMEYKAAVGPHELLFETWKKRDRA